MRRREKNRDSCDNREGGEDYQTEPEMFVFFMMCWFNWDHFSQCLVYSKSLSKPCTTLLRYYEFPPVVYFIFPAFVYNNIL